MYDLIVIGAGPAGVSACLYARARGMKVAVFEKNKIGGLIGNVSTVSHYTGLIENETGNSIASRMDLQLRNANVDMYYEEVTKTILNSDVKTITTNKDTYQAKKVIIAAGSSPKQLEIDNEKNLEIHYNTTEFAEKYKGKEVFVNGGSDGAAKEAIYLSKYCSKVNIIQIAPNIMCIDEFSKIIKASKNINIYLNSSMTKISGEKGRINNVVISENGKEIEFKTDDEYGVFAYIGQEPNTSIFEDIELENGYIKTHDEVFTNLDGVYAIGDIRVKAIRQVATAVSDGVVAGIKAAI